MANKETIKGWFTTGSKPTEKQFWAWIDSVFHKDDKIPIESVEGMDKALESKADAEYLSNHLNDEHAHEKVFNEKVDKEFGKGLSTNDFTNVLKTKLEGLNNADLSPYLEKGGYSGTAAQLKKQIDDILSILNSQDTSLDDFNEIVTFIKQNKKHLDALAVDNIAGLRDALNEKADALHHHDDRYYKKQEIDNLLLYKVNDGDERLTNSRPASDVYSWAKATNKPTYTYDEIINKPNNLVTIGDLKEAIDGIIIGGENLVKNSNKEIFHYNFSVELTEPLVEGNIYTFSFEAKGDLQGRIFFNNSIMVSFPKTNALEYKRFSVTFVYERNDYQGRQIYPHVYGATHLRNLKLEKGTKPTDWTPSPEDKSPLKLARYTQAQIRALSPNAEEGDLVYQTDADKGIKMFDGNVWVGLALAYP